MPDHEGLGDMTPAERAKKEGHTSVYNYLVYMEQHGLQDTLQWSEYWSLYMLHAYMIPIDKHLHLNKF